MTSAMPSHRPWIGSFRVDNMPLGRSRATGVFAPPRNTPHRHYNRGHMCPGARVSRALMNIAALVSLAAAHGQTFQNPIFTSQDPFVVFDNGTYYYSESNCGTASICIKTSPTLTGLATANWTGVWNAPPSG